MSTDVVAQAENAVARWHARRAAEAKREHATAPPARRRRAPAPAYRHRGAGRPHTEQSRANIARSNLNRWASRVDLNSVPSLTRARVARGLSTRAAAALCQVSPATFRRVELDKPVGDAYRAKVIEQFPEAFE